MSKKKLITRNPLGLLFGFVSGVPLYQPDRRGLSDIQEKRIDSNTVEFSAADQIFVRVTTFPESREVEFAWRFLSENKKHQQLGIKWSHAPIERNEHLSELRNVAEVLRSVTGVESRMVHVLDSGSVAQEKTVRHQFPDGGDIYLHITAEGDRWHEVILHHVTLALDPALRRARGEAGVVDAEVVLQRFRNLGRNMLNIKKARADIEAELKAQGITPVGNQSLYKMLQAEEEKLIRDINKK